MGKIQASVRDKFDIFSVMGKVTRSKVHASKGVVVRQPAGELTEQQLKERDRVRSGILSDFQFLIVFDEAKEGEDAWEIMHRTDLIRDPPGVSAAMKMPQKTRKQKMCLMVTGSDRPVARYIFSRVEKGKFISRSMLMCLVHVVNFSRRIRKSRSSGSSQEWSCHLLQGPIGGGRHEAGGLLVHSQQVR